jgi:hypothetical protein
MLFRRKIFEDWKLSQFGALCSPPSLEFSELSLISCVKPIEKYLAFEPLDWD